MRQPLKFQFILPLLGAFLLCSCASAPQDYEKITSNSWPTPQETSLGKYFTQAAPGNKNLSGVFLLDEPRAALRARLGLASLAEKTLDLQYYLWKGDTTGGLLLREALKAADRGVQVRILIDDIYHSGRDDVYASVDAHPFLEIRIFNPIGNRRAGRYLNFLANKKQLNHRMHNKIFLVDNAATVMGGRNIGDDYFGIDPKLNFRDLDVLAVGPVAVQAGAAFDLYWNSRYAVPVGELADSHAGEAELGAIRKQLLELDARKTLPYTVPRTIKEAGQELDRLRQQLTWVEAEIIVDPLERFDGAGESAFARLSRGLTTGVEKDLVLQSAYLIPSAEGIRIMASLTARGVRVRALTNSLMSNNHATVHAHYMKYRKEMIRAGVEVYELRADAALLDFLQKDRSEVSNSHAGLHTKAAVVDQHTTLIGSFNMDPRSRELNSEIALLIRSEKFAGQVLQAMERDFDPANSYRVTLNDKGRLRWAGTTPDGPLELKNEPGASIWKRMMVALFRLIPIEKEL